MEFLRDFALFLFERLNHTRRDSGTGVNLFVPGNEVFFSWLMKRMTWSFPAGFLHSFEVARPFDGPKFDGLRWLGLAAGDEKKEEEKDFDARGSLRN